MPFPFSEKPQGLDCVCGAHATDFSSVEAEIQLARFAPWRLCVKPLPARQDSPMGNIHLTQSR
jgi:hypothetical protein